MNLDEFMNRDPQTYTDEEIKSIVAAYRQQRVKFIQEDEEAKLKGRRPKAPKLEDAEKKSVLDKLNIEI